MDKYEALRLAQTFWQIEDKNVGYLQVLARTGIFTHVELAKIAGVSPAVARNATVGIELPYFRFGDRFDPRTLDSILIVMEYYEAKGQVPRGIMDLILPYTSIRVVSRLTGIGVTDLANPEPVFA